MKETRIISDGTKGKTNLNISVDTNAVCPYEIRQVNGMGQIKTIYLTSTEANEIREFWNERAGILRKS